LSKIFEKTENRRISAGTEAKYFRKREKLGEQLETMQSIVWFECFISLQQEKIRKVWPAIKKEKTATQSMGGSQRENERAPPADTG
jgi:hypothetical protein